MKSKKIKVILIICILILLLIGSVIFIKFRQISDTVNDVSVEEVDLNNIADGIYIGEYSIVSLVYVQVKVTVRDSTIESVQILQHENGLGTKAESITDTIMNEQSLDVDAISGATVSSKTIVKSVENALLQGKGK